MYSRLLCLKGSNTSRVLEIRKSTTTTVSTNKRSASTFTKQSKQNNSNEKNLLPRVRPHIDVGLTTKNIKDVLVPHLPDDPQNSVYSLGGIFKSEDTGDIGGDVRTMVLNSPQSNNALTPSMLQYLYDVFNKWDNMEGAVYATVLRGTDGVFSGGVDWKYILQKLTSNDLASVDKIIDLQSQLFWSCRTSKSMFVAGMNGVTSGAGASIALNCNVRAATDLTVFSCPETSFGFIPFGLTAFLAELGPMGMFLALTGYPLHSTDLLHAGIASHFVYASDLPNLARDLSHSPIESTQDISVTTNIYDKWRVLRYFDERAQEPFSLENNKLTIQYCFSEKRKSVQDILGALDFVASQDHSQSQFISDLKSRIQRASPLALEVTFRLIRKAGSLLNGQAVTSTRNAALHHIFKLEQSAAHELIREPDFVVSLGRAINKHKQQWSYPTLSDVPSSLVDKILSASPKHNSKSLEPIKEQKKQLTYEEYNRKRAKENASHELMEQLPSVMSPYFGFTNHKDLVAEEASRKAAGEGVLERAMGWLKDEKYRRAFDDGRLESIPDNVRQDLLLLDHHYFQGGIKRLDPYSPLRQAVDPAMKDNFPWDSSDNKSNDTELPISSKVDLSALQNFHQNKLNPRYNDLDVQELMDEFAKIDKAFEHFEKTTETNLLEAAGIEIQNTLNENDLHEIGHFVRRSHRLIEEATSTLRSLEDGTPTTAVIDMNGEPMEVSRAELEVSDDACIPELIDAFRVSKTLGGAIQELNFMMQDPAVFAGGNHPRSLTAFKKAWKELTLLKSTLDKRIGLEPRL